MRKLLLLFVLLASGACAPGVGAEDLPSWNEGPTRAALVAFVEAVTDPASPDFVPVAERVAVFDNDGTLWSEQPLYFQLAFVMDRVKELAPQHPEWASQAPFSFVLEGDLEGLAGAGYEGLFELVEATHSGVSTDRFSEIVEDWLATARHPATGRAYTAMVFQPMLELLDYLHSREFAVYIVSGGGQDFMRPWVEDVYGIPPGRVVGSYGEMEYAVEDGVPVLKKKPGIAFIDDKEGKPVAIQRFIGQRPILAVGNSDGDFQMLEWSTAGQGRRLGIYIHHTDAEREWAYDRDSHVGRLDRGLDEAGARGWLIVDMARDWAAVFPE